MSLTVRRRGADANGRGREVRCPRASAPITMQRRRGRRARHCSPRSTALPRRALPSISAAARAATRSSCCAAVVGAGDRCRGRRHRRLRARARSAARGEARDKGRGFHDGALAGMRSRQCELRAAALSARGVSRAVAAHRRVAASGRAVCRASSMAIATAGPARPGMTHHGRDCGAGTSRRARHRDARGRGKRRRHAARQGQALAHLPHRRAAAWRPHLAPVMMTGTRRAARPNFTPP